MNVKGGSDNSRLKDAGGLGVKLQGNDYAKWRFDWLIEQWSEEAVEFCRRKLAHDDVRVIQDGNIAVQTGRLHRAASALLGRPVKMYVVKPNLIPIEAGITSDILRKLVGSPEQAVEVAGNLLLNAGIQRMEDNLKAVPTATQVYDNTHSRCGVGDSATGEVATQTDLQAATNVQYKLQNATYPQRPGSNGNQSVDWRSDFLTGEANYVWNEWIVDNGTANGTTKGAGAPVLNRKVQSLGTKSTGTWTLTGTLTIS